MLANAETTKFKIYCKVNNGIDEPFIKYSDVIEYVNLQTDKNTTIVTGQKISLRLSDGDNGIYNYYGLDNHFKSTAK